jgi:hypothetical protein
LIDVVHVVRRCAESIPHEHHHATTIPMPNLDEEVCDL